MSKSSNLKQGIKSVIKGLMWRSPIGRSPIEELIG